VLDGYAKFLRERQLVLPKHQPYLVRWVREFLLFARQDGGYTFEQTPDLFLAEVGGRVGEKPWQVHQAREAIRLYGYFLGAAEAAWPSGARETSADHTADAQGRLLGDEMTRVLRVHHLSLRTERSYLRWLGRFARQPVSLLGRCRGCPRLETTGRASA